jgi:hypothetical protein
MNVRLAQTKLIIQSLCGNAISRIAQAHLTQILANSLVDELLLTPQTQEGSSDVHVSAKSLGRSIAGRLGRLLPWRAAAPRALGSVNHGTPPVAQFPKQSIVK